MHGHRHQIPEDVLRQFRKEVFDEGILREGDSIGTDDDTLLRFLRARKFDLKLAKKMLRDCQDWRKTVEGYGIDKLYRQIDPFDYPERQAVFECWPMWFHKRGRPLNIHQLGNLDLPRLFKTCTPERHWQSVLVNCESLTREILPAASRGAERTIGTVFVIVDLKGFGIQQFWQMKSLARRSFQVSQDYYPETMGQLAIVNAPASFTAIWAAIRPWLSKETAEKVDILGSDYREVLLDLIDAENLPRISSRSDGNSTSSNSSPSTTSTAPPSQSSTSSNPKYVVAHHMVGNTYTYAIRDWAEDITHAHGAGIDGFALNMGRDDWQSAKVADAYEAARQSGLDFKLFISFDMASFPCGSPQDAGTLRNIARTYLNHQNQLRLANRAVISTFAGESCTFGQDSPASGWRTQFVRHPDLNGQIYFIPAFFIDPNKFGEFQDVMNGDFHWNSGWPTKLTTPFVVSLANTLPGAPTSLIGSLQQNKAATASNNNLLASTLDRFIYVSDQHLYVRRWESLIASRDQVDIVQVITWNDYGESHYIGPIKGVQPNSQAWVDGMDHTAWLDLTSYYATAFKTGSYPPIKTDQLYMWSRTHPAQAQASDDPVGHPENFEISSDSVWVVVMITTPATKTKTFNVNAGVTRLSIPIAPGGIMHGAITRGNDTIVELRPKDFVFNGSPSRYNYNAFVAGARAQNK
ncbi:glycoside hydrolase family 71 protein [Amanita thiersii Skay4041]|uniref:Glycoside hydrolase family 71 protein n=1 Tax=Amanita thiersii Skay4041 TaxID=703135 RepID=A0A2A9NX77_9AGAR|nr:glycoside hydrolase family 71 protein [Amanita thiersii Skay4041]